MGVFSKKIIPLVVVENEMTIAVGVSRRVVGSLSSHIQRAGIIPQRREDNFVLERSNIMRTCKIRQSGSGCIAYEFYEG